MSLALDIAYVATEQPGGSGTSAHVWSRDAGDGHRAVRTVTDTSPTVAHAVGVIHGGVDGARVSCGDQAPAECSSSVIFVPIAEGQRWIGGELRVADGWKSPPGPQTNR
jgi:hypothetical protein